MSSDAVNAALAQWTVLVYMVADDHLARSAEECLAQICSGTSADAVHVAVQIHRPGGAQGGPTTTRYSNRGASTESAPVLAGGGKDEKARLKAFIDWGLRTCPARRSLLVVWTHGEGVVGLDPSPEPPLSMIRGVRGRRTRSGVQSAAIDASRSKPLGSDHGQYLTNPAFREAIAESAAKRVDVLGCDACLMGMVEIAYEMRGVAGFMVAAETDEPKQSWPYAAILASLRAHPAMAPAALAQRIVHDFDAWYGDPGSPNDLGYAAQTAVNLSEADKLVAAIDALAAMLDQRIPAERPLLQEVRDRVECMENPDYVDLDDLLDLIEQSLTGPGVTAATQSVRSALDTACINRSTTGQGARGARGLAIYFPRPENAASLPAYRSLAFAHTRWPAFLRAYFATAESAPASTPERSSRGAPLSRASSARSSGSSK